MPNVSSVSDSGQRHYGLEPRVAAILRLSDPGGMLKVNDERGHHSRTQQKISKTRINREQDHPAYVDSGFVGCVRACSNPRS